MSYQVSIEKAVSRDQTCDVLCLNLKCGRAPRCPTRPYGHTSDIRKATVIHMLIEKSSIAVKNGIS